MGETSGSDAAQGQVQYVAHFSGTEKWHGEVTCLQVDVAQHVARIAGVIVRSTTGATSFRIIISDPDSGAAQNGDDMAKITTSQQPQNCDPSQNSSDDATNLTLARGNFQIHQ